MKKVNVAALKNELSRYLHQVRKGEEILVMDRKHAVAKIVAVDPTEIHSTTEDYLRSLEEDGIVMRGKSGKLGKGFFANRPKSKTSVLRALLEEREEGW